jgi:hypothetical protein
MLLGYQIRKDERGGVCVTHGKDHKFIKKNFSRKFAGKRLFEEKNSQLLPGLELPTIQHVAQCYIMELCIVYMVSNGIIIMKD